MAEADVDAIVADLLVVTALKVLRDSKQLTRLQRERVADYVRPRLEWSTGEVSAADIDRLGLRTATDLAAGRAMTGLNGKFTNVLADAGLHHPYEATYPTAFFIKGDEKIPQIGLASCMAKVTRDRYMRELALQHTGFGWETNVGYGSGFHISAIRTHGITPHHRRSFLNNLSY